MYRKHLPDIVGHFIDFIGQQRVVLLDCDMIVMRNMDELIDLDLPEGWIAAVHACACNPRKLAHYPADWLVLHLDYPNLFLCEKPGFQKIVHTPH